jgi:hypothetical protein
MAKKNYSRKTKPFWERGYAGHGYWQGKEKIGWVAPEGQGKNGSYRWQAGSRAGEVKTLAEAKRAVEESVLSLARQLPLFGDSGED